VRLFSEVNYVPFVIYTMSNTIVNVTDTINVTATITTLNDVNVDSTAGMIMTQCQHHDRQLY
jgi:hypothetical protein